MSTASAETPNLDFSAIDRALEAKSSTIARDLKLNLKRVLEESSLPLDQRLFVLLASAKATGSALLLDFARSELKRLGVSDEHALEAEENAALMGMLNAYYKFRGMVEDETPYKDAGAGLRMTAFARPALGKEIFEKLALTVSIVNGCPSCIKSHEKTLRESLGVPVPQLHDLARIAAVTTGVSGL